MNRLHLSVLLKEELQKQGWSIKRLSEEAGVAFETARRARNGTGNVRLDTAAKLLKVLGCDFTISIDVVGKEDASP